MAACWAGRGCANAVGLAAVAACLWVLMLMVDRGGGLRALEIEAMDWIGLCCR